MALDQRELGQRLKRAREAVGLSQEAAGARIGLVRGNFAQIEAGNRKVTSIELTKLAHLYGRDAVDFFAAEFREDEVVTALFRTALSAGDESLLEVVRNCLDVAREFTRLENRLGVMGASMALPAYHVPTPNSKPEATKQGRWLAEEERRRLGLGSGPLGAISALIEGQGVRTGLIDLPVDISGLKLSGPQVGAFVVVNSQHSPMRQRFSFAHEFCHVLLDRWQPGLISRESERDELYEVRANVFAANFLMPEEGVRRAVLSLAKGQPSRFHEDVFDGDSSVPVDGREAPGSQELQVYDVVWLVHQFQVSYPAMLYRLLNLGLIKRPQFDELNGHASRAARLANELKLPKLDLEGGQAFKQRFVLLALEAYRRGFITEGKLKDLGRMAEVDTGVLLELAEGLAPDDDEAVPDRLPDWLN